eukprot:XP_008680581.1 uncharacterized protein LOC103655638 [Zea mays]
MQAGDEDDDFMPLSKKRNFDDSPTKVLKKIVTKQRKAVDPPRQQRLNVRCNPQNVIVSIQILNDRQRQAIARRGFSSILDMRVDALGSRSHLAWLMEKLDHNDMTIRAGPGKELKITKETVHLILGLPNAGGGKALGIDEAVAANNLRAELGLSKEEFGVAALQDRLGKGFDDDLSIRYFFLILFNRLLFPTARWGITNHEVLLTEEMDRFHEIDWCQIIFNDFCQAAKKWHTRSVTNVSTTIYGCSIVILLYYLDHLHDSAAPQNKRGTPRIKYFDRNIIQALTRADKGKIRQGQEPFGHCSHKNMTNTFDVPRPDPSGQHTIYIELPLIRDLISSKLNQLPSRHRLGFIEKLSHYDTEVGKACSVIKQTLQQIVEKQYNLSNVFGELIDEVLRAESGDNEDGYDVQKTTKKSDDILP